MHFVFLKECKFVHSSCAHSLAGDRGHRMQRLKPIPQQFPEAKHPKPYTLKSKLANQTLGQVLSTTLLRKMMFCWNIWQNQWGMGSGPRGFGI